MRLLLKGLGFLFLGSWAGSTSWTWTGFSCPGVSNTSSVTSLVTTSLLSSRFIFWISFSICFSRSLAVLACRSSRRCCGVGGGGGGEQACVEQVVCRHPVQRYRDSERLLPSTGMSTNVHVHGRWLTSRWKAVNGRRLCNVALGCKLDPHVVKMYAMYDRMLSLQRDVGLELTL